MVAHKWNFPVDTVEAIACHHIPGKAKSGSRLPHIVCMGNALTHKLGIGLVRRPGLNLSAYPSARVLGLDALKIRDLADEIEDVLEVEKQIFS